MFVECFGGGAPAEGLAGSGVKGVGDRGDVAGGPPGQVGALRKILAQQGIGVLIGAALPRALGICEVHLDPGGDRELRVCR